MTRDLRVHTASIKAELEAAGLLAFPLGEVPGTQGNANSGIDGDTEVTPERYVMFGVQREAGDQRLTSGEESTGRYIVWMRAIGPYEYDVQGLAHRADTALNERLLIIAGRECFVSFLNQGEARSDDKSRDYSLTLTWTYVY